MKLFAPGPTEVHPDVLAAMAHPQIAHRTEALRDLVERCVEKLRRLLATRHSIYLVTSSATGAIEGAIRNCVERRLLVLRCGSWSDRLARIAAAEGFEVEILDVPLGEAHDPADVTRALESSRPDAVALIHCETSTGVLEPLDELVSAIRARSDALVLVDAVSSAFALPIGVDALGIDVLACGVQKALAMPPGLSILAVSPRALARARGKERRGFYFDFVRFEENARRHETPTTPSTAHLFALDVALDRVLAEGLENRHRRHLEMAAACRAWARRRLALFGRTADERFASPTVTCVAASPTVEPAALLHAVLRRGYRLGAGYGPLARETFRIGHMGEHTPADVAALLSALDEALEEVLEGR